MPIKIQTPINIITMKHTINLLLLITLFVTLISCSNKNSSLAILSDPEKQDEVLTAIANDSTLLTKLHRKINMGGDASMMTSCMAMMDDPKMMSRMMDNMMMYSEKDSTMGKMMCDKMMNSENMKKMMQDRMDDHDMDIGKNRNK